MGEAPNRRRKYWEYVELRKTRPTVQHFVQESIKVVLLLISYYSFNGGHLFLFFCRERDEIVGEITGKFL